MNPAWILLGVVVLLLLFVLGNYNAFVRLRQHVRESWRNIDVQLQRRYDLIPNLVETVKGYAAHEKATFEAITNARTRAAANHGSVASQGRDEQKVVAGLRQLFALQESYPELKADKQFLALQEELVDTEDRIAAARRFYNANVRDYNNRRESFPTSLIAGIFGFGEQDFWQVEESSHRENPQVKL